MTTRVTNSDSISVHIGEIGRDLAAQDIIRPNPSDKPARHDYPIRSDE